MASMASVSTTEPIFNDEESNAIDNYFATLIKEQDRNGWKYSNNYYQTGNNYLQLKDLKYIIQFFTDKILIHERLLSTKKKPSFSESIKGSLKKLSLKKLSLPKLMKKNRVLSITTKNNNTDLKNKQNIDKLSKITHALSEVIQEYETVFNTKSAEYKMEFLNYIDTIIFKLIKEFILNKNYFNQQYLKTRLIYNEKPITFIFMIDEYLKHILDIVDNERMLKIDTIKSSKRSRKMQTNKNKQEQNKAANESVVNRHTAVFGKRPLIYPGQKTKNNKTYEEEYKILVEHYKSIFGKHPLPDLNAGMRKLSNHKTKNHKKQNAKRLTIKHQTIKTPNYKKQNATK